MHGSRTVSMMLTVILMMAVPVVGAGADDKTSEKPRTAYDRTDQYHVRKMHGWRVLVNRRLDAHEELRDRALALLQNKLYEITRAVPAAPLAKLREVPIWFEYRAPKHLCACYHPDVQWLRKNGFNPEKENAVEIANAENFLLWSHGQPWMVLHELAHAYHDRVLGFDDAEVIAVHRRAVASNTYNLVLHANSKMRRHYALTNHHEYFAEMSEAYFGTNDFFPFVNSELAHYDPAGYALMKKVWGVPKHVAIVNQQAKERRRKELKRQRPDTTDKKKP